VTVTRCPPSALIRVARLEMTRVAVLHTPFRGDRLVEWGKLYANLPDDPRVQAVEDSAGAAWLLVESMCYCTSAETDGFIPRTQVERFGGGPRKKQKVAALVREELWIPVADGYLLDPRIWNEERNLNDQAERKRKADRERIAAKREKDRATDKAGMSATLSRDSRATCRATGSGDSRPLEESREEKTSTADLTGHLQVADAREIDDDGLTQVSAALAGKAGRIVTPDEARHAVSVILGRAERSGIDVRHALPYALQAIADEPDVYALLVDEPPPLAEILASFLPAGGIHPFDEDPGTGLCSECKTPESNWHHPRPSREGMTASAR
jgi:hypothetical protein